MNRRKLFKILLGTAAAQIVVAKIPQAALPYVPPEVRDLHIRMAALKRLQSKFRFSSMAERATFPSRKGEKIVLFRYSK